MQKANEASSQEVRDSKRDSWKVGSALRDNQLVRFVRTVNEPKEVSAPLDHRSPHNQKLPPDANESLSDTKRFIR